MINKNRQLDVALFHINKETQVNGKLIESGWNQLIRQGNIYQLYHFGQKPYVNIQVEDTAKLAEVIFSQSNLSES